LQVPFVVNDQIDKEIADKFNLGPAAQAAGSEFFELWAAPKANGAEIYNQIVVWNLTNPDAVLNGSKAKLQLLGLR
jgi:hypothetical protein